MKLNCNQKTNTIESMLLVSLYYNSYYIILHIYTFLPVFSIENLLPCKLNEFFFLFISATYQIWLHSVCRRQCCYENRQVCWIFENMNFSFWRCKMLQNFYLYLVFQSIRCAATAITMWQYFCRAELYSTEITDWR